MGKWDKMAGTRPGNPPFKAVLVKDSGLRMECGNVLICSNCRLMALTAKNGYYCAISIPAALSVEAAFNIS